jgi:hypothetical protein
MFALVVFPLMFEPRNLNQAFLSLFHTYNVLLQQEGSKKYKVPHSGKEHLENTRILPIAIAVGDSIVPDNVLEDINEEDIGESIDKRFWWCI